MRALVLLVPLVLAGCSAPEGTFFARDAEGSEPYYKEYRETLEGEHHKDFALPVEPGALLADVQVGLASRTNGLPLPEAAPAQLTVRLLDRDGTLLGEVALDARTPTGNITLPAPPVGSHLVRVDGFGASQPLDGRDYGAAYTLALEVLYAR